MSRTRDSSGPAPDAHALQGRNPAHSRNTRPDVASGAAPSGAARGKRAPPCGGEPGGHCESATRIVLERNLTLSMYTDVTLESWVTFVERYAVPEIATGTRSGRRLRGS